MNDNLFRIAVRAITKSTCVIGVASVCFSPYAADGAGPSRVAVAWTDGVTNEGFVSRFAAAPPWSLDTPVLSIGAQSTLRLFDGLLYAVNPS